MLSFPLIYIAIPFAILLIVWGIYAFLALLHALKFGSFNKITYLATVLFLGLSVLTVFIAWQQLEKIDWQYQINLES